MLKNILEHFGSFNDVIFNILCKTIKSVSIIFSVIHNGMLSYKIGRLKVHSDFNAPNTPKAWDVRRANRCALGVHRAISMHMFQISASCFLRKSKCIVYHELFVRRKNTFVWFVNR